jgi:hypothetical protein
MAAAAAALVAVAWVPDPGAGIDAVWAATGQEAFSATGCDNDGLGTALQPVFQAATGYTVVAVEVSGIHARCAGQHVSVALTDQSGAVSSQGGPALVPAGGGTVTVTVRPVAVSAAARVHALIN